MFVYNHATISITIDRYISVDSETTEISTDRDNTKNFQTSHMYLVSCIIWFSSHSYIYISMNPNKTCIKYHCPRLVLCSLIIQQLAAAICVTMTTLNYKMFKISKEQRQRMASEFVLQPQQSESEQTMTWLRHLARK